MKTNKDFHYAHTNPAPSPEYYTKDEIDKKFVHSDSPSNRLSLKYDASAKKMKAFVDGKEIPLASQGGNGDGANIGDLFCHFYAEPRQHELNGHDNNYGSGDPRYVVLVRKLAVATPFGKIDIEDISTNCNHKLEIRQTSATTANLYVDDVNYGSNAHFYEKISK